MSRPLIFDRHYVSSCSGDYSEPGTCPRCDRELVLWVTAKRYCGRSCKDAVHKLPEPERSERRAAAVEGRCVRCGTEIDDWRPVYRCPRTRNAWLKVWRANAGGRVRFGPEAMEWLAEKIGLDPLDERLPSIALELARAGRLTVCVDGDAIVGLAKPKDGRS